MLGPGRADTQVANTLRRLTRPHELPFPQAGHGEAPDGRQGVRRQAMGPALPQAESR